MDSLFVEQFMNGIQFGMLLFLMAAGLTLIFGIMDFINLAHGSLFMIGAYLSAAFQVMTGSFLLAIPLVLLAAFVVGAVLERTLIRRLYASGHLRQVLATFGLILMANETVIMIWGVQPQFSTMPAFLEGQVHMFGVPYSSYRLAVILAGAAVALGLYLLVARTRLGMLIRAGATNRAMVQMLGVDIRLIYLLVFALGALLAALAGAIAAPILSVQPGMGERILIQVFVVIIIGGLGSIRGSFVAALLVGIIDTVGRAYLRDILGAFLSPTAASEAGPALASMLIYILMAAILVVRPQGLFPVGRRT